ncbi:MAG: hypothetical protein JWL87_663 [Candidatus Adlerbacteria bacterium]|nr:hypothetical protein [Candidatus Adlerbacteria bacterium]
MPRTIRTNQRQRDVLEKLRERLFEQGYVSLPVAPEFRRHQLDLLVVHKTQHNKFFIVRPTPKGFLSITMFTLRNQYDKLQQAVDSLKPSEQKMLRWSNQQLRYMKQRPDWWKEYFPPEHRERLEVASF